MAATEAKLIAARERGLPVITVRRRRVSRAPRWKTVAAVLDWLAEIETWPQAVGVR